MHYQADEVDRPAFDEPLASLLVRALAMERHLAVSLPDLVSVTDDPVLRKQLEHHLEETREHVQNVEEVFEAFGRKPEAAPDHLLEALWAENWESIQSAGGANRAVAVVATAAAAEHAEIARYEVLRALADARGNSHAVELIVRTLAQEREALRLLCESMHRLLGDSGVEPDLVASAPDLSR